MHIAFLTPEFPHAKIAHAAGIGTSIKNLTTALINEGVKVTVFVYGQKTQEVVLENGITIHLLKKRKYRLCSWFFYRKFIQNYCSSIIKREKIELLEIPDWTGISAFMNFKIPLIIRFHGSDTYFCHLENRKQKLKNFWFEKLAVIRAKAFIAPTTFAGDVSKELFKINSKEIKTIHYGLELENFTNNSPEIYEKDLILYVGTLIRKKGVLELPEIFNKVHTIFPNAKLVLIGSDSFDIKTNSTSTWQLLQNQFTKEDLKYVTYLGKIPYQEVRDYIKKANVCVFPTFAETLGMVTIESMAMQKAVVNSSIGWAQELIIDKESGFLVHPSNSSLYAEKIIQLLENDSLCSQIGKQARTRVEDKFDIKKVVTKNIEFYQEIINKKR
ncbi:glycosyltransferase family 4 protein [Flavobacterium pectinovorum]|uniref:glycosyltransferase family 4 protein n=1 Tax=Flavobacterium pectinovorum TaxID=29533 RepID=UPI00265DFEDF|nr:glycosyltransferase family 4 protein [Flavobacterium pectinovorum]WKL45958.1 glycosyltransferase family 4 protein [Flavobacterium pectinovorum]